MTCATVVEGIPEVIDTPGGRDLAGPVGTGPSGRLDGRSARRREQRRLELLRRVEPRRPPWSEDPDEGVGDRRGRVLALPGHREGDVPSRAHVPLAQELEGRDTFVLCPASDLGVAVRRAGRSGERCRLTASRDLH